MWAQGKPLVRDVTVLDTFTPSHLPNTSLTAGAAADKAAVNKTAKYDKLRGIHLFFPWQSKREDHGIHLFFPVAIEMGEPWNTLVRPCGNRDGRTMEYTCSSLWQLRREDHGIHLFFPVAIETEEPWNTLVLPCGN